MKNGIMMRLFEEYDVAAAIHELIAPASLSFLQELAVGRLLVVHDLVLVDRHVLLAFPARRCRSGWRPSSMPRLRDSSARISTAA